MWCQKCQADVAGIASPDNERALCTTCGNELARSLQSQSVHSELVQSEAGQSESGQLQTEQPASRQSAAERGDVAPGDSSRALRDPRELLARWAREDALDPVEFAVARGPVSENRKPQNRFDAPHSIAAPRRATLIESVRAGVPLATTTPLDELPPPGRDNMVHQAHAPNPPHIQSASISPADTSSRWMTLVGQICAYVGVGALTIGTSLILLGYFGGPASYVTTGWLVTTAGQMLLFLGVVTLVSGGMEQTTQEVARRIDTLGERLMRIEQAAERAEAKK
jgi:hypothetical protein